MFPERFKSVAENLSEVTRAGTFPEGLIRCGEQWGGRKREREAEMIFQLQEYLNPVGRGQVFLGEQGWC